MTASQRQWFAGLSPREKWLVLTAAVLAVLTFIWFAVIRPVNDALAGAKSRHTTAVLRLAATESQMAALKPLLQAGAPAMTGTLEATVRDRATQAGFVLTTVSPQTNNALLIGIASAKPAALFGWIADMERDGFIVDSLSTTDNGDHTISAQITWKLRGI
ncbi:MULTISPECIES: type II secretion system protein GspM [Sphingomonas]|uniref:type II secretion system protein GspM n=1 Tax=Sphingomonas TaxID=13687 RepID=UPI0008301968|nr:type II secretion system protein GspM [Sphingomonas sp. CCH10-B3]